MDTSKQLVELIRTVSQEKVEKLDHTVICMVESVNADGTVNIQLPSDIDDNIIRNIPNNSPYILNNGDLVVLYKIKNKLNNSFIFTKVTNIPPIINSNNRESIIINNNSNPSGRFPTKTSDLYNDGNEMPIEAENPFTTKSFVNSSIATNTANFIGTFQNVTALNAYSGTVTNNDYAFVINQVIGDFNTYSDLEDYTEDYVDLLTNFDYAWVVNGTKFDLYRYDIVNKTWGLPRATEIEKDTRLLNTAYNRYKATVSGSTVRWDYEYTLNNSSFTAAQWAAINSGVSQGNWVTTGTTQIINGEKTFTEDVKINGKTIIFTGDCKLKSSNSIYRFGDSSDPSGVMVAANASGVRFLRPGQNNIMDLGTTAVKWKNLYLSNTAYIPIINNGANISVPTTGGTMALTSDIPDDGTVTATASRNTKRDTSGNVNAVGFNMCTIGTETVKASMQYNTTNDTIEFVFS